jgi:hypothetical protein
MAEPWTFNFQDQTFTFSNGPVTFEVATTIEPPPPAPPESVTVDTVSLTTPHGPVGDAGLLGITHVEVPPPVIEHVAPHFDLLI